MRPSYRDQLDELRCHPTEWLRVRDRELECEQRRLRVEQLAVRRVLDERHAIDVFPDASVPLQQAKATVEVGRALESLPALAEAAREGRLSWEQLEPLTRLAHPRPTRSGRGEGSTWHQSISSA